MEVSKSFKLLQSWEIVIGEVIKNKVRTQSVIDKVDRMDNWISRNKRKMKTCYRNSEHGTKPLTNLNINETLVSIHNTREFNIISLLKTKSTVYMYNFWTILYTLNKDNFINIIFFLSELKSIQYNYEIKLKNLKLKIACKFKEQNYWTLFYFEVVKILLRFCDQHNKLHI